MGQSNSPAGKGVCAPSKAQPSQSNPKQPEPKQPGSLKNSLAGAVRKKLVREEENKGERSFSAPLD